MRIARIDEPVIGAFTVVIDGDILVKCESREEAERVVGVIDYIETKVELRTKRTIRNALGLRDFDGGVIVKTVKDDRNG